MIYSVTFYKGFVKVSFTYKCHSVLRYAKNKFHFHQYGMISLPCVYVDETHKCSTALCALTLY